MFRPVLQWQKCQYCHGEIGNCLAPCISEANEEKYKEMLRSVIEFLNGKTGDIRKQLKTSEKSLTTISLGSILPML